jgi:hypothetical protein
MIGEERDELIEQAAQVLRPMPRANARAVAHIMAAVRARAALRPSRLRLMLGAMREPSVSMAAAGILAAAALVIGFFTGDKVSLGSPAPVQVASAPVAAPLQQIGNSPDARVSRAVPVSIVFEARNAKSVSIVGDFNSWDETAAPMKRFGSEGPWTVTVRATPGRHEYAFLVDGTTLVADPRAPRALDRDFGGDASVLMVTEP